MPEKYVEEGRYLFLKTPVLGDHPLLLESYTGHEGISELFSFDLELLSADTAVDFSAILGKSVTFGVAGDGEGQRRNIHGIVTSFSQLPRQGYLARYRATVRPSLWKLTLKRQSRIFQKQNVTDILKAVLGDIDHTINAMGTYEKREYCVQYRETDFDFISRLMEEEGLFYYFKQDGNGDRVVIDDTSTTLGPILGESTIEYDDSGDGGHFEQRIYDWQKTLRWDSGRITLTDHTYRLPGKDLKATTDRRPDIQVGTVTHSLKQDEAANSEIYDHPGGYARFFESCEDEAPVQKIFTQNSATAKHDMERVEAGQVLLRAESDVYNLAPGYSFTLAKHFNADGKYVVTGVTHSAREGGFVGGEGGAPSHFSNIFTCIPSNVLFRPPLRTAKPPIRGCQTALVVGPGGEEIYTDKLGRIKVQFHWDREGQKDANSSCWIRVASYWAGKQWGAFHLPRIGQEVVVDFLEGDPDKPLVIGSVYNAENMPPYALPDNRTQSTLKSRSSLNGGTDNFNEIRFEDKKGSEEVFFQAEKDLNSVIKHDETRKIGNDRTTEIKHDETKKVEHNQSVTITNDETLTVNHDRSKTIANNDTEKIGADVSTTIGGKRTSTIASNNSETVGGSESITVGSSQTVTIASSVTHNVGASRSTSIAASDTTTTGASFTLTAGASVTITAGASVSITSAAPVTITAPMVSISAAMVQCAGVVQCTTLIAAAGVVSPVYSPGAGNIL